MFQRGQNKESSLSTCLVGFPVWLAEGHKQLLMWAMRLERHLSRSSRVQPELTEHSSSVLSPWMLLCCAGSRTAATSRVNNAPGRSTSLCSTRHAATPGDSNYNIAVVH